MANSPRPTFQPNQRIVSLDARILGCLLGFAVVATLVGSSMVPPMSAKPSGPPLMVRAIPLGNSSPRLEIEPASWLLNTGNSTNFSAVWSGVPANCSPRANASAWGFDGNPVLGRLNRTTGASVDFDASATASGITDLTVRSSLDLQCGTVDRTIESVATAPITVVGPLRLDNPTIFPNPSRAGAPMEANVTIDGGLAPYRLSVYLGNGAASTVVILQTGPVSFRSSTPSASFVPSFSVADREGTSRTIALGEPEYVSSTFEVAIRPGASAAEDGLPFNLSAEVLGGVPPYSYKWELTTRYIYFGPTIRPTFSGVTSVYVFLYAQDSTGDRVGALELLNVVAPVRFSASFPVDPADANIAVPLEYDIRDGVGPYWVRLDFPGYLGVDRFAVPSNGSLYANLLFTIPGQISGLVQLTDSNGVSINLTVGLQAIEPSVKASISAAVSESPTGAQLSAVLNVIAGVPPFAWDLDSTSVSQTSDQTAAYLPLAGSLGWSGIFALEGNLTLFFRVIDSLGAESSVSWIGVAIPPLTLDLSLRINNSAANRSVAAVGTIDGGLPPYEFWFDGSDGAAQAGNLSTPGNVTWTPTAASGGVYTVRFRCADALGDSATISSSGWVEPLPPTAQNNSPNLAPNAGLPIVLAMPWTLLVATSIVLFGAFIAATFFVLRRRRARRRTAPTGIAEDAEQLVARLLDESDGLDVETLEYLAAEEGVVPDLARAAVARGLRERRWRSETAADGTEFLRLNSGTSTDHADERELK